MGSQCCGCPEGSGGTALSLQKACLMAAAGVQVSFLLGDVSRLVFLLALFSFQTAFRYHHLVCEPPSLSHPSVQPPLGPGRGRGQSGCSWSGQCLHAVSHWALCAAGAHMVLLAVMGHARPPHHQAFRRDGEKGPVSFLALISAHLPGTVLMDVRQVAALIPSLCS